MQSFKKLGTAEELTDFLEARLPSSWAADVVLNSIDFYKDNADAFGNKNDFPVAKYLVDVMCQESPIIFVCGLNEGQSTTEILQACPSAVIHGFEIQAQQIDVAKNTFAGKSNVILHHAGLSDKGGKLAISGEGELAGLYSPSGRWKDAKRQGEVQVLRPTDFLVKYQIDRVAYFVIDVEGHEQEVIKGMGLATNAERFPIFQYELGGTWADSRRTGPWTQFSLAFYLELLGYDIYIMGLIDGHPALLRTAPDFYRFSIVNHEGFSNGGQRFFVQGNALAVNPIFISDQMKASIEAITIE
jgi:FkbM family methyltransferase